MPNLSVLAGQKPQYLLCWSVMMTENFKNCMHPFQKNHSYAPGFKKSENMHNSKLKWIYKWSCCFFQKKKWIARKYCHCLFIREGLKRWKLLNFIWTTAFLKTFESTYKAQFTFQLSLAASD